MALTLMEEFVNTSQKTLLEGQVLTSSYNLNNITDYGIYSWSASNAPTNAPTYSSTPVRGSMIVMKSATAGVLQFVLNENYIYLRYKSADSGWTAWRSIASSPT